MRLRRWVTLILSVIMVVVMSPMFVSAATKEAYVELDNGKLTFYYDEHKAERNGDTYVVINDSSMNNGWTSKSAGSI